MGDRSAKRRATGNLEAIGDRSAKWRPTGNPNHSSSMADRSARRRAMGNLEAADEDLEGGHGGGVPNFVEAPVSPNWLQPTYNLETQPSRVIGDYYSRKRDDHDNLRILKPWNMARTIDTTVMETGPKICQEYIEHPALFKGKKFDLQLIVLVRSMKPLKKFLADLFWNYIGRINHMNVSDFVREFEEERQVKWHDIHERILNMIRSVFESAAAVHREMHCPFSRSMYGVDAMLDHLFMPKLLEVTYVQTTLEHASTTLKQLWEQRLL